MTVGRRVRLPRGQAAVALARDFRRRRIDLVEIVQNRADGRVQAVEIEAVERHPVFRLHRGIMLAQPVDEAAHFVIAPHPDREAGKGRPFRRRIFPVPHIMIDARGVGPVAFDGDEVEALLQNQFARDRLAHAVEFRTCRGWLRPAARRGRRRCGRAAATNRRFRSRRTVRRPRRSHAARIARARRSPAAARAPASRAPSLPGRAAGRSARRRGLRAGSRFRRRG